MSKDKKTAIIVGITTFFTVILFIAIVAILSKWNVARDGFTVYVKFNFLNDILPGAPVKLAGGIEVGYIEDIRQEGTTTIVELYLKATLKDSVPKSEKTQFAIFTTGMMGQKYINLSVPQDDEGQYEYLQDGDTLQGVDPPSIDQIMLSFTSWFDGKSGGQVLAEVVKETKTFITGLNTLLSENRSDIRQTVKTARISFAKLSAQLDTLMGRLNNMTADLQEISNKNKEDIQLMLKNLSYISKDFNVITKRIQSGHGSIGKFVYNEEIYNNMNQAAKHAKVLFKKLRDKPHLLIYKR
jgi:phospholipid/cholesterol/gamma-HCH transport system substrate-binding protein